MNRLQHFTVAPTPNLALNLALNLASLSLAILIATNTVIADWPQWRGPGRTGVAAGTEALAATWPDDGPVRLWDSEPIPSRDDGGLGSAIISGRHAYLFVVWAKNVPVKQRIITTKALRSLGWPAKQLPDALSAKVEASRKAVNPRALRGNAGKTWAENWIKSNLSEQEMEQFGNIVERRLRDGPEGLALELLEQLAAVKDKPFADQHSLDQFLAKLKIDDRILQTILKQIPPTRKVANDVVICLELQTGKTAWKKEFPGLPHGPRASSTPCIKNGRLYVAGSTHAYCLDASDGKMIWRTPLTAKGIASSFAVADGIAVTLADSLIAFDVESGKQLWEQKEVRGRNSSPTIWKHQQTTYVLCNSSKQHVACVELKTGKLMWKEPGGGDQS